MGLIISEKTCLSITELMPSNPAAVCFKLLIIFMTSYSVTGLRNNECGHLCYIKDIGLVKLFFILLARLHPIVVKKSLNLFAI